MCAWPTEIGSKYRFHWQNESDNLIKRWDNAPHHPEIITFPDHLHDGLEDYVIPFNQIAKPVALG